MASRFLKPGTEVRASIEFGERLHHLIVEVVTSQDQLTARLGHDGSFEIARVPGTRFFSVPEPEEP